MKEKGLSILIIMSLLAMISFVVAESICPGVDALGNPVHGVEIGGECFNCGDDDGICPEDFFDPELGWSCEGIDPDCLVILDGWWSESFSGPEIFGNNKDNPLMVDLTGEILYMIVTNTGLNEGDEITFNIYEEDGLEDLWRYDDLGLRKGIVNDEGMAVALFEIKSIDDLNEKDNGGYSDENKEGEILELKFTAYVGEEAISSTLFINATYEIEEEITSCGDYIEKDACNNDICGVGGVEVVREDEDGCKYISYTSCSWNETMCLTVNGPETAEDPNCTNARDVSCAYEEGEKIGDCDAGDDFFKINYVPVTGSHPECESWTSNAIPCPQQLRVPFFGFYGFIISLLIISLIYLFLIKKEDL